MKAAATPWLVRNVGSLKVFMRVVFGIVWLVDGALKFAPGLPDQFPGMVSDASQGQPAWLAPWFNMWNGIVASSPAFWVYLTGVLEVALGLAFIFGFMRKIAYIGGALLALFIWAVPEGFGGPYGPGATDIGTGIIYAFVSLGLIIINATYGPSKVSLDAVIEKRFRRWWALAEFQSAPNALFSRSAPLDLRSNASANKATVDDGSQRR